MEILGNEMSREEAFSVISQRKIELLERIKKGQTEEKVPIGGVAYTDTEWKKLIKKLDNEIDEIKEEQKERKEKVQKEKVQKEKIQKAENEKNQDQEVRTQEVRTQEERDHKERDHKEMAIVELYEKEISFPYVKRDYLHFIGRIII